MLRSTLLRALPALAAATLAACSDSPTSPAATRAPQSAPRANFLDPAVVPGYAEVRTLDGKLFGGAELAFYKGYADSVHVLDNSERDLDKADGKFKVMMPATGTISVWPRKFPQPYGYAGQDAGGPRPGTLVNGEWQFPSTHVAKLPSVRVSLYSRYKQPALGAGLKISLSPNGWYASMAFDGGYGDLAIDGETGALDGVITVQVPREGEWNICETKAPIGYLLAEPRCAKVTTTWGGKYKATLFHDTGIVAPPAPSPM